ncbi:MAG TPA: glycosyltransferase family A protein [Thermoanaerobaculia bacterium]|nr:MAG: UDP-Glc:alpha-D-GlcNAc-diphosphoundecaprenol beta-1,3-glucosyltransferase WfgD [Acidobacteria bacterium ADurb.Bin051]HNU83245.1 glycosyltransferase family A protein [Thermoanaerobaculia bacterium]
MIHGLVSVIVPVKNRPDLLREAVASVFAQTLREWELLIVDDRSTDETPAEARELAAADSRRVKVLEGPGRGPGLARETGRQAARGEFLQYLDSDDLLLPRKLESQVGALRGNPRAGIAYGPVTVLAPDGTPVEKWPQLSDRPLDRMFPEFLRHRFWHTGAALFRREVSDRTGPWLDLSLFEDWEYDCRLATLEPELVFVPETGVVIRACAPNRIGSGPGLEPWRLRERARAHELILGHARRAGIGVETSEMAHFARALFLLARQCGRGGLSDESRRLFTLARTASTPERSRGLDFRAYRLAATVLGWRATARLFTWLRGLKGEAGS